MAEFLTTTGVSERLENIITGATEQLVLISPYLKINDRIKGFLGDKDREFLEDKEGHIDRIKNFIFDSEKDQKEICMIYGKKLDQQEVSNWLASASSITIRFRKNLHAKCYLNENEALLTSMNLHEFSQQNNDEMGILVSRKKDRQLYDDIHQDAMRIVAGSEEIRDSDAGGKDAEDDRERSGEKNPRKIPDTPKDGFCIRCRTGLPVSPRRPYCKRCHKDWKQFENPKYKELYCHTCGNECETTLVKPLCYACYKKYKDVFEFAVE